MRSLSGVRVVVTRAIHQAEELARPLRERGAEVVLLPTIEIAPPVDSEPLRRAAANCDQYDWIIFTSTNAVEAFASAVPSDIVCEAKIATVGEATRVACEQRGFSVSLTPGKYVAEALAAAFAGHELAGRRVLIPSAAATRDVVPIALRQLGATVDVMEAYRNVVPADAAVRAAEVLRNPYPEWVLFASPSALTNLVRLIGADRINRMRVGTIGPSTSAQAQKIGVQVKREAATHDVPGLIELLLQDDC